jgi:RNA polymerase sigma-70 factor (ECF subfamily)
MDNSSTNPEAWVDNHGDALFRYALGRVRNQDVAENLVQETFLAGLKSQASFSGQSAERTWLIAILKHKIIDHLRASYREKPVTDLISDEQSIDSFFDETDHLKKEPGAWNSPAENTAEKTEFWQTIESCLQKLPQKTADAFSLREIENMDTPEICKVLGITPTNLWVMLHRARLQLRECLQSNWFENVKGKNP